jgi:hypothetical protein
VNLAQAFVNSKCLGAPLVITYEPSPSARTVGVLYTFEDGSRLDYPSMTDETLGNSMRRACREMVGPDALDEFMKDTRFLLDGERVGPQTKIETFELDDDTASVSVDAMVPKNLQEKYPSIFAAAAPTNGGKRSRAAEHEPVRGVAARST